MSDSDDLVQFLAHNMTSNEYLRTHADLVFQDGTIAVNESVWVTSSKRGKETYTERNSEGQRIIVNDIMWIKWLLGLIEHDPSIETQERGIVWDLFQRTWMDGYGISIQ
jgi:hypothetical protein